MILTTTIKVIIGRRLPNKVVYKIKLYIKANKDVITIAGAIRVLKKTIYKLRLNLDIWGESYTPPIVILRQLRLLLPYQKSIIYNIIWC